MGRYNDAAQRAVKAKTAKSIDSAYWKPESKGDMRIGMFIDRFEVEASAGTGTYFQYLVETDDGLIKFALGTAGDKEYGERLIPGTVYIFEFDGKESIPGGRTVNRWKVTEIPQTEVRDTPVG